MISSQTQQFLSHTKIMLAILASAWLFSACSIFQDSSSAPSPVFQTANLSELELLERATSHYSDGLFELSRASWSELRDSYPASAFSVLAELKTADCYFHKHDYSSAVVAYQEFERLHPKHEATPYVRFQIATALALQYEGVANDQQPATKSLEVLKSLREDFPRSEYALLASEKLLKLRNRLADHELLVAEFYHRQGKTEAANKRFKELLQNYPDTDAAAVASEHLSHN